MRPGRLFVRYHLCLEPYAQWAFVSLERWRAKVHVAWVVLGPKKGFWSKEGKNRVGSLSSAPLILFLLFGAPALWGPVVTGGKPQSSTQAGLGPQCACLTSPQHLFLFSLLPKAGYNPFHFCSPLWSDHLGISFMEKIDSIKFLTPCR